ncbi:MAG: hypothetical protein JXR49_02355 [Acidobacteria bacterium]|nr:hypothetical protein [Acidobacteriota bacterium]
MKQRLPAKVRIVNIIKKILLAAVILGIVIVAIPSVLFYKVSHSGLAEEPLNPSYYLLKFSDVRVTSNDGKEINGWWIPGDDDSAGIILSPGYGMSRSDVLSLATELHSKDFNILIYGQRGSSASPQKMSTFGLKESEDLLPAIDFVQSRPECDRMRIGIWGVDVGAYSAMLAAASVPEVRAVAADSVFGSAYEFLDVKIEEKYGLNNRMLQFGCKQILKLLCMATGSPGGREISYKGLSECSFLFITGENRKKMGRLTASLYEKMPSKKEIISFETSRIHMMKGKEFQDYDRQVADFFLQNLQ